MVARRYLHLTAAFIWGIPGISITLKGIKAYSNILQPQALWLFFGTMCTAAAFFIMFRKITNRYIERISTLPDKCHLHQTFPLRGWILLLFMMGLGTILGNTPTIPLGFTSTFYSGLGPMLILSSKKFLFASIRL